MRIAYVNKSDSATITASSSAGSLVAANLKTIYKSQVWRSTGLTATLTVVWPEGKQVSVVCLPFCNLSASATVRIRGYTLATDASPAYDSGTVVAIPPQPLGEWPWGSVTLGVNSFAVGRYSTMVKWVPVGAFEKIVIDLVDSLNTAGYIEAGRLFISSYYQFELNSDYGSAALFTDSSTTYRNDANDLLTDRGNVFKTLTIPLPNMRAQDRAQVSNILKLASANFPVLVSLAHDCDDAVLEQEYQVYGKLTKASSLAISAFGQYATDLEVESV